MRGRKVRVNMIRVIRCGVFLMLLICMTKGEVRYGRLVSVYFGLEHGGWPCLSTDCVFSRVDSALMYLFTSVFRVALFSSR